MKIGILTYHRSHNYGALLQAIALRKVLTDMGHIVTFIDYWPDYHRHMYALFSFYAMMEQDTLRKKVSYIKNCLLYYNSHKKRKQYFNTFIAGFILPYTSSVSESYDLIIHGSDQIWRKQPEIHTYNPFYFGKHDIKALRKITYAASMGIIPDSNAEKEVVKELLSHLDEISVRETDLRKLVESLGYTCTQQLDPTLLLTGNEWKNMINIHPPKINRYVIFYNLLEKSFDIEQIRLFAKEKGLKLITLYSDVIKRNSDSEITVAGPVDFLELIYGAEYVFTSSFHGLVFSLLFQKQFFAAFNKNANRAASLLSQLRIVERLLPPMSKIPRDMPNINYDIVSHSLQDIKMDSLDYLRDKTEIVKSITNEFNDSKK